MEIEKRRVLIFGGTTEGRHLAGFGLPAIYSAVTPYGTELAKGAENVEYISGRMNESEMEELIKQPRVVCVIDAAHPYAREAHENIKAACAAAGKILIRVGRSESELPEDAVTVKSAAEAADFLEGHSENALLTTGSKELEAFDRVTDRSRLFARVLPDPEVIKKCAEHNFDSGHIIAAKGPFSVRMNEEILRMTKAEWIVTKDGGAAGGTAEKIAAAKNLGIRVVMIERPCEQQDVCSEAEALLRVRRLLGVSRPPLFPMLLDIENRKAVIAGGGKVAARRAATLLKCGASVTAVSPEFSHAIKELRCSFLQKEWEPRDLDGAFLAVAATDDRNVNSKIAAEAKKRGIPASIADDAGECGFFFPSLVSNGEVSASVSAGALSPALTHRLANRLREVWDTWVEEERKALEGEKNG